MWTYINAYNRHPRYPKWERQHAHGWQHPAERRLKLKRERQGTRHEDMVRENNDTKQN